MYIEEYKQLRIRFLRSIKKLFDDPYSNQLDLFHEMAIINGREDYFLRKIIGYKLNELVDDSDFKAEFDAKSIKGRENYTWEDLIEEFRQLGERIEEEFCTLELNSNLSLILHSLILNLKSKL